MDSDIIVNELSDEHYEDSSASDDSDPVKGSHLPVARVKKIMKEGEHQGMISSDAPVILAKACEMLIRDLTMQSWDFTQTTKRCTLQRQDITCAIFKSNVYNFLFDLLSPDDLKPVMESRQGMYMNALSEGNINSHISLNKMSPRLLYPKSPKNNHRRICAHPYRDHVPPLIKLDTNLMSENIQDNNMVKDEDVMDDLMYEDETTGIVPLTASTMQSFSF